jgi:hypothetical protein
MNHGGCEFRTELEAKWAVFFDEMELDWAYLQPKENEYCPDFYLPQKDCYIEISEKTPTQQELNLYDDFAEKALKNDTTFRLIIGEIPRTTSDFGAFKTIKQQLKKPTSLTELNEIRDRIQGIQAFKLMKETNGVMLFGQWAHKPNLATKLFKSVWIMGNYKKVDAALIKARKARF